MCVGFEDVLEVSGEKVCDEGEFVLNDFGGIVDEDELCWVDEVGDELD